MPVKTRIITKHLSVKLTEQEVNAYAHESSREVVHLSNLQVEKAEQAREIAGQIKRVEKHINELSRAVDSGQELRDVECEERLDFDTGFVVTTRLDTMEEIGRRSILGEDRQMSFDD